MVLKKKRLLDNQVLMIDWLSFRAELFIVWKIGRISATRQICHPESIENVLLGIPDFWVHTVDYIQDTINQFSIPTNMTC